MCESKSYVLVCDEMTVANVWQKFEEAVQRNHGFTDDLYLLAQPDGDALIEGFAKQLVAVAAQRHAYVVPVNYGLSHKEQIEAARFDWFPNYDGKPTLEDPTEHLFPIPSGEIKQRMTLFRLCCCAKTEEVLAEMDRLNLRPALSTETLAFAKEHPNVQFPIIGLGSVWVVSPDGRREVLYLDVDSDGRYFDLRWLDGEWDPHCRFLAVHKNGS